MVPKVGPPNLLNHFSFKSLKMNHLALKEHSKKGYKKDTNACFNNATSSAFCQRGIKK